MADGIREPLMADESRRGDQWMVYLSTLVAVCGSYEFGCCIGYSSPTQSAIREDLNLTLAEYSVVGSILTIGAMVGAITIGPIADFLGRKGALRVSSAFCVAGWLAIYFSEGVLSLDIGRMASGYGMGAFSYLVPVFIAEIAPKNLRGRLTAVNQLMICVGSSVSFIIGVVVRWRALALIGIVPCAVTIFGLFFIPESPRWLAKTGRHKDFEAALQKLRGKDADISHEAAEIQDYIATLERLPKAKLLDLFQTRYLRSVIVVVTGIGASVMDKAGRRPLIVLSASGLVLGSPLTAISFFLKVHDLAHKASPILAVTGILVYIGSFAVGMGAVPWVIMSEIFPINIKGQAGSVATLVNWFGAWLCSYTFNCLMSWSSYGTFVLYAAINALAIAFVVSMVPETKGKTLEQIQGAINK